MRIGFAVLFFLGSVASAMAQMAPSPVPPSPAPQVISVPFTPTEIEANLNLVNDAVKAFGLSQPQRVQDALGILSKFQAALRADADARAKAASEPVLKKD